MIIVAGWIDYAPEDRDACLEARLEAMVATLDEPGCIDYIFTADPVRPGRLRLFERWESREDLDVHLVALRSRPPSPRTFEPVGREVTIYEANITGTIG